MAGKYPAVGRRQGAHETLEDFALDAIAEQLSQPLCAIAANVDAIGRLLDRQPPDLAEIRAALADLARDTQRAVDRLRSAQCRRNRRAARAP